MPTKEPIRRVAFVSKDKSEFPFRVLLGVLNYREHAEHWQLLGPSDAPLISFEDLDLNSVDGIIGLIRKPAHVRAMQDAGVPTVNVSTVLEDTPLPRISNDDEQIGRVAGEHLLERGFSNFAFIGLRGTWFAQRRLAGFRSAIETARGPDCPVFTCETHEPPLSDAETQWLSGLPKPVAIMASNDQLGCDIIGRAWKLGLRVPDDVAVLGVDNDRWSTRMAVTPMSSIEIDGEQIGYRAANMLDGMMAGQAPPPTQWIPPVGVVTRRSTDIVLSDDPIVAQALTFIRDHCDRGVSIEDVLDELGVSRRNLELHLKRATGQTPRTAIFGAQVERAKKLLVTTEHPMYAVGSACGFDRQDRFSIVFKRMTGLTPGQYRRRYGRMND